MTAETPERRPMTAKELAARVGKSERLIRKMWAEPRDDYETRAEERRAEALRLYEKGLSYQGVADELGITRYAAAGLVRRARLRVQATLALADD